MVVRNRRAAVQLAHHPFMINENPLTGIGFGNYLSKHLHYQGINYELQGRPHDRDYVIPVDQPHFQILETASETGPWGAGHPLALYRME